MPKILPGLIFVNDLITQHPADRAAILKYEIQRRERERLLFQSTRKLVNIQIWGAAKSILIWGLTVFFLVLSIGQLAGFAKWIQGVQNAPVNVPVPLVTTLHFDVHQLVPTSTAVETIAKFPLWSLQDAGMAALVVMALMLIEKIVVAFFGWRQSSKLHHAAQDLEDEIDVLQSWLNR